MLQGNPFETELMVEEHKKSRKKGEIAMAKRWIQLWERQLKDQTVEKNPKIASCWRAVLIFVFVCSATLAAVPNSVASTGPDSAPDAFDGFLKWHSLDMPPGGDGPALDRHAPLSGDFDGDSQDELFYIWRRSDDRWEVRMKDYETFVLPWSNSYGTWTDGPNLLNYPPVVADVDGDGRSDIVFMWRNGWGSLMLRTRFSRADRPWFGSNATPYSFNHIHYDGVRIHDYPPLAGDIDGDGCDDLIFRFQTNGKNYLRVKFSTKNTPNDRYCILGYDLNVTLTRELDPAMSGSFDYPAHVGDIDGDGVDEIVFVYRVNGKLAIKTMEWHRISQVWYEINTQYHEDGPGIHQYPSQMGDVDGDGDEDLVFIWREADELHLRTKLSRGDGSWETYTQKSGDGPGIHQLPTRIGDITGDGKAELVFSWRDGQGRLRHRIKESVIIPVSLDEPANVEVEPLMNALVVRWDDTSVNETHYTITVHDIMSNESKVVEVPGGTPLVADPSSPGGFRRALPVDPGRAYAVWVSAHFGPRKRSSLEILVTTPSPWVDVTGIPGVTQGISFGQRSVTKVHGFWDGDGNGVVNGAPNGGNALYPVGVDQNGWVVKGRRYETQGNAVVMLELDSNDFVALHLHYDPTQPVPAQFISMSAGELYPVNGTGLLLASGAQLNVSGQVFLPPSVPVPVLDVTVSGPVSGTDSSLILRGNYISVSFQVALFDDSAQ